MRRLLSFVLVFAMALCLIPAPCGHAAGNLPEAGSLVDINGFCVSHKKLFQSIERLLTDPESPMRYRGGAKVDFQYPASTDPQYEECNITIGPNLFNISALYEHDSKTDDSFELFLITAFPDGAGGIDVMQQ
ncbi:MAG: hypothetical protein K6C12_15445 [Oscillospiraceae bacterium]|nr:hypothetical protein [Oscillospiraceae bacterium]